VLGQETSACILFPDAGSGPFPVLYLFHGLRDDSSSWLRKTRLEVHAEKLPLLIVMPDGYRSFYTDHESGPAYASHYGKELPALIDRMFPTRAERSGRAVGGFSMGGYGALRIGLGFAEDFCSIHSHSGAESLGTAGSSLRQDF
jgi:putative tributyrin esterase